MSQGGRNLPFMQNFVREIIDLYATPPATNASYGGMIGASNPRQQALEDLKRTTLKFAAESTHNNPDPKILEELAKQIEGSLLGLNSLQVIDDQTLDKLITRLYQLTD
jgi:hypothetical protein